MYIGKTPIVGNFQKCDALTASATADYTLQVSSANVVPESANHMLVSLNGILQAPITSFTVSGSTLSFASALTSSDSIDFVILLGNVLDIGVPSDDTCGAAQIKDDLISGTTALAVAPADTDEFLVSDAGTLKRIDYSLIKAANTPAFEAGLSASQDSESSETNTKIEFDSENIDTDGCYDNSTNYRFTPTTAGKYYVYTHAYITPQSGGYVIRNAISKIYKNGSQALRTNLYLTTAGSSHFNSVSLYNSGILDMNGSSDYVESYFNSAATSGDIKIQVGALFGAYKLIGV